MSINEERTINILKVYQYLLENKLVLDKAAKKEKKKMKTIEMAPKKRLLPIKTSKGVFIMPNKVNKRTKSKLIS